MASDSNMKVEKNYAAYIYVDGHDSDIYITVINLATQKEIHDLYERIPARNSKQFVNNIPSKFRDFQSIILSVFDVYSDEYKSNLEFRKAIRSKLLLINARYLFIKDGILTFYAPIYAANITLNVGENVVIAMLLNSNFECLNYKKIENGYSVDGHQTIPYRVNDNVMNIRKKLTTKFYPKELIVVVGLNDLTNLEKMKDAHVLINGNWNLAQYKIRMITEYSKRLLDQSSVKTLLLPSINNRYLFMKYVGDKHDGKDLSADNTAILPFTKTIFLPKLLSTYAMLSDEQHSVNPTLLFLGFINDDGNTEFSVGSAFPQPVIECISTSKKCHGIKFTVEVDVNNFPTFTFRPMILKGIRILPQMLDDKKVEIPVIGFFGNLSVICVRKNGAKYEFLEDWGGMYGSELFISFDEEKIKYCDAASAMLKTKPTFIVYDLLKILSMPVTETDNDKTWHFNFTKDSENPILIEFDNFDGTKKSASPQFLMALLLKQHLNAIKNEIGKKPKQIGFCFFKVDDSVKERLKNQICESFELLRIEHRFIDI